MTTTTAIVELLRLSEHQFTESLEGELLVIAEVVLLGADLTVPAATRLLESRLRKVSYQGEKALKGHLTG